MRTQTDGRIWPGLYAFTLWASCKGQMRGGKFWTGLVRASCWRKALCWKRERERVCVDVWYFMLFSVCFLQQTTKKLTSLKLELNTVKKLELSACNTCCSYRVNLFSSAFIRVSQQFVGTWRYRCVCSYVHAGSNSTKGINFDEIWYYVSLPKFMCRQKL